jgi:hypothetical protein
MGEFAAGLRQRIRDTQAALRRALDNQDPYDVQIEQSELDDLLRIAQEHGVDTPARGAERLETVC